MSGARFRVGSTSPLDWRSGHEYLLAALHCVRSSGRKLVVDLPDEDPDRERVCSPCTTSSPSTS